MSGQFFSEAEIDDILSAVEETLEKAQKLAKGFPPAKGDNDGDEGGDAPDMEAAQGQDPSMNEMPSDAGAPPAPEASPEGDDMAEEGSDAGAAPAPGEDEMSADPAAQGQENGEEQLEGDNGELNDEELHQIYSSMDPSELERHYMIIRSMLRDAYAKMEKSENSQGGAALEKANSQLRKDNEEMKKSIEAMVKTLSVISKPQRKAVTEIFQVINKGEGDTGTAADTKDYSTLSKSEIVGELNKKVQDHKLSKSDRELINGFLLHGENHSQIIKLLGSK